jgi:hypothetical protein
VDAELFERAFDAHYEAVCEASGADRFPAGVGAVALLPFEDGVLLDHAQLFQDVCWRVQMFDDLLQQQRARLQEASAFPHEWLSIAACAPLERLAQFDSEYFQWPSEQEEE